jgi:thiol:disulfide interchange protein DsbC
MRRLLALLLFALAALSTTTTIADGGKSQADLSSALRRLLESRMPELAGVDEIRPSPIPNLYEVRKGAEIFYTDATGGFLISGQIVDTRARVNLTQQRIDQLTAISFHDLPFKHSFTVVRGNGKRKLAVFEDPNCGYCKRFERDLQLVNDVTIYMFMYPILGQDSVDRAKAHWCAQDRAAAWKAWMLEGRSAPAAGRGCNADAVTTNVGFGKAHQITGTPTLIFQDGSRIPGAIATAEIERLLQKSAR